jgi:hypothetical protein
MAEEFDNGMPYAAIAGEIVADVIALWTKVRARRPETTVLDGMIHVTVDARNGVILVGLHREDKSVVLLERVLCDPTKPETFGQSELPIVIEQTRSGGLH